MKKFAFLIVLILIYIFMPKLEKKEVLVEEKEIKEEIIVKLDDKELNLEEYIVGVVACEMPASFNIEALKAMAVASRTYALSNLENNIIYSNGVDQCYITIEDMNNKWGKDFNKYYNIIEESVKETRGKYISYNSEPIKAFYFSMSNGQTENVENVFSENFDYLKSVSSPWDISVKNCEKTISYSQEELMSKLKMNEVLTSIEIISRNETNRVNKVKVNNNIFTGKEFRTLLNLRSTDFEIAWDNEIKITTKGYGHGVGMSQYGANGMANEGYTYEEILKYYYQKVEIKNV